MSAMPDPGTPLAKKLGSASGSRGRTRRWGGWGVRRPTVLRAFVGADERVLELLPELRIHRLGTAKRGFSWDAVELREFVDKRIRTGQIVRHLPFGNPLVPGDAGRADRRHRVVVELEVLRDELRLRQVDRILDDLEHGEQIAMPDEVRRHRGLVAAGCAVAAKR